MTKLDPHGKCPECGADWDAGPIPNPEHYSPPYRFSRLIGVELPYTHPEHYDGVSYWMCPDCKHEFPRFKKVTR